MLGIHYRKELDFKTLIKDGAILIPKSVQQKGTVSKIDHSKIRIDLQLKLIWHWWISLCPDDSTVNVIAVMNFLADKHIFSNKAEANSFLKNQFESSDSLN